MVCRILIRQTIFVETMKKISVNRGFTFVGVLSDIKSDFGLILSLGYILRDMMIEIQIGWSWYLLFSLTIFLLLLYLFRQSIYQHFAKRIVEQFYQLIQSPSGYFRAWNLLSQDIKKQRWGEEDAFSSFENGFKYTKEIDVKSVSIFNQGKNQYDFIVLYADKIEAPTIEGLIEKQESTIGEISELKRYVHELGQSFQQQGLDKNVFMSIPLKDFFRKNFSDIVRWRYGVDILKNMEKTVSAVSFFSVKVVCVTRRWRYGIFPVFEINEIIHASDYFKQEK